MNDKILDINYQFGKRIKFLRNIRKISQEELAFRCELNTKYYSDIEKRSFMEFYKSHSYLDGKTVSFSKEGKPHTAVVLGITDNAGIILKEGNSETVLNAGEVSVKPI